MPYTISFSDPTKIDTITVPDMPPGINTVDTSLSLVGRGYPNYGQKIAENFVHLLENFAGPVPPANPIEGQLWYDTSNPNNKVLRVMDGTASATRWPSANGIYQQGVDPKDSATQGLKVGDIWVDTASNQLKIYNSNSWTVIGPSTGLLEKTGPEATYIRDTANIDRYAIKNWVAGEVVSIEVFEQITPKVVIPGFTVLRPGINLRTAISETNPAAIFNGTAVRAQNLIDSFGESYSTDLYLRKNDQSQYGQIIDGVVKFRTPSTNTALTGQGRDGIVINNSVSLSDSNYIQFFKGDNDAIVLNNTANGKIVFKVRGTGLSSVLELSPEQAILTGSASISKTLTVANTLTVLSDAATAVSVAGGVTVSKNLNVGGDITVVGTSSFTGAVTVSGNILPSGPRNIGSSSNKFNQIYAVSIFADSVTGATAVSANSLTASTDFKLRGQLTSTTVTYDGQSIDGTFVTSLTPDAISSQTVITATSSNLNLLVLDTSSETLNQISRDNFLGSVFPTGMIMAFGSSINIPTGWLLCDGSDYVKTEYQNLFSIIGTTYGAATTATTWFRLPDMRSSTTATNATTFVSYIIKT